MSDLTVNTKKLDEIYKEWRGNESCYDNGRPVFDAAELLDFAEYCLKHEANGVDKRNEKALYKHDVSVSLPSDKVIEQVACDEAQQDWNDLAFKRIYKEGFIEGAKWMRTDVKGNER